MRLPQIVETTAETAERRPTLKELAEQVAWRQPLRGDAAMRVAMETASLAQYRAPLLFGRLHLCGNCRRYTFGQDPGGPGTCALHREGLLAFAMPFYCRNFTVSATPTAPDYLPTPQELDDRP